LLGSHGFLYSQVLEGLYVNNRDSLHFSKDFARLTIVSNGGMVCTYKGAGSYSLSEEYLIIDLDGFKGNKSNVTYTQPNSEADSISFSLSLLNGKPIPFANVGFRDDQQTLILGANSNRNGLLKIQRDILQSSTNVTVTSLCLKSFQFQPKQGLNHHVHLAPYWYKEDCLVVLKLIAATQESIEIMFLGFVDNQGKLEKGIRKLEKHASKMKFNTRTLNKVTVAN
jgi:hypothetical protein